MCNKTEVAVGLSISLDRQVPPLGPTGAPRYSPLAVSFERESDAFLTEARNASNTSGLLIEFVRTTPPYSLLLTIIWNMCATVKRVVTSGTRFVLKWQGG